MSGKIFKITIIILICLLVAVVASIFTYGFIRGYSPKYIYKKLIPGSVEGVYKAVDIFDHDGYEGFTAASDGTYIYLLEGDDVAAYDSRNGNVSYISPDYTEPILTSRNNRVVLYDAATGVYTVLEDGDSAEGGNVGTSCLGSDILSEGSVGFSLPGGDGFRGSYVVFDNEFSKTAEYNYSDRYPVAGCSSPENSYVAIAGILENNAGKTGIDIYEKGGETPVGGKTLEYLAPVMLSFGKDAFALCGTESIDVYSFTDNNHTLIDSGELKNVYGTEKHLFAVSAGTGMDRLMRINENGSVSWENNVASGVKGMYASTDHVFCWTGTKAEVFDMDGSLLTIQGEPGAIKAVLGLGEYRIAVVTDSRVILYEFN